MISGDTPDETQGFIATPTNPQTGKNSGNPCDQPGSCGAGDPINVAAGNVFEQVTVYQTAGQSQLRFDRYYNSRSSLATFARFVGFCRESPLGYTIAHCR